MVVIDSIVDINIIMIKCLFLIDYFYMTSAVHHCFVNCNIICLFIG